MNCYSCNEKIRKCKSKLCHNCKSSSLLTFYESKIMYGLTDKEILNANLFSYSKKLYGKTTTKYLISEIIELAKKLNKIIDVCDDFTVYDNVSEDLDNN